MRIVITGAAGKIGTQLVEELQSAHELRLIDVRPVCAHPATIADLSQPPFGPKTQPGWGHVFERADAVLHLAANPRETASWSEVLEDNIEATWNVLEAAATHAVPRVVFASSNWAVKAFARLLPRRRTEDRIGRRALSRDLLRPFKSTGRNRRADVYRSRQASVFCRSANRFLWAYPKRRGSAKAVDRFRGHTRFAETLRGSRFRRVSRRLWRLRSVISTVRFNPYPDATLVAPYANSARLLAG